MSAHDSDGSVEPGKGLESADHEPGDYGLYVFFALGVLAVAAPQLSFIFGGPYWAALAAIAVFVLWISVMPTTCMSGGLYCSLVAMAILFNTLGIVLFAADPVRGFTVFVVLASKQTKIDPNGRQELESVAARQLTPQSM